MKAHKITIWTDNYPSLLTALLTLAITFTLSCSGSDDPDNSGDPNNGGGVPFNENSQVYNAYYEGGKDGILNIDTEYKGSGIIKISSCTFFDLIDGDCDQVPLNAGSVTNGVVTLNMPTVPNEYLSYYSSEDEMKEICTDYPKEKEDIKTFSVSNEGGFILTDSNGEYIGGLNIMDGDKGYVLYQYFSKDAKFTCNSIVDGFNLSQNMNAKAGWNKIYASLGWRERELKFSTANILTKELKWVIYYDGEGYTPQ
jgi:hypothetical protein